MVRHSDTRATVKGQIVIPAALRRKYGIKKGTRIEIYEEKGGIVLQPITLEYVEEQIKKLRGSFKGSGLLETLVATRSLEKEKEERELKDVKKTARLR